MKFKIGSSPENERLKSRRCVNNGTIAKSDVISFTVNRKTCTRELRRALCGGIVSARSRGNGLIYTFRVRYGSTFLCTVTDNCSKSTCNGWGASLLL